MIKLQENKPLSIYCTIGVGGPADYFFEAETPDSLISAITFAKQKSIPYFLLGQGTNVIFPDEGYRGLVIKLNLKEITAAPPFIKAGAGVLISKLINESLTQNLEGLEKWIGLPGTVGGAVRGNAGCGGLETKDILTKAEILDPETLELKTVEPDFFEFDYRHSHLKNSKEILISATFKLRKSTLSPEEQKEFMKRTQISRLSSQPFGKTCGSFFKNPSPDRPAGKLIEEAGLKGHQIGGAKISDKHANFIINTGGATAKDILALANLAKEKVKEKFNIQLQEEVQIVR